jgi:hypothetical protein
MKFLHSKFASAIAAAYVSMVVGGLLLHFLTTGDFGTLRYSLMLPSTLGAIFIGSLLACGLWRGFAWAWWLGLVATAIQLIRFGSWFIARLSSGSAPVASWIIAILLAAFLCVLLIKATRQRCSR